MTISTLTKTIDSIDPEQIHVYLQLNGWLLIENVNNIFNIWRYHKDDYDYEVIQPISNSIRSYSQRIYESLATIASFEEKSIAEIIENILASNIDQVKIRVIHVVLSREQFLLMMAFCWLRKEKS